MSTPKHTPRKNSRPRFQNMRRNLQHDLLQLKIRLVENKFGCCEGIILKMQQDLTRLYGVMLEVQDEYIKLKGDAND